ncbi:hypothetical protein PV326_004323 [Microctonus aethiopoides]|nr:hypothetical protein PV326_004323 [Microctonus aethiopoides]
MEQSEKWPRQPWPPWHGLLLRPDPIETLAEKSCVVGGPHRVPAMTAVAWVHSRSRGQRQHRVQYSGTHQPAIVQHISQYNKPLWECNTLMEDERTRHRNRFKPRTQ